MRRGQALGELQAVHIQQHLGHGGAPVTAQRRGACARERADHGVHVRLAPHGGQRRLQGAFGGGVGEPSVGDVEDELAGAVLLRGEVAPQQIAGVLRAGARQPDVVRGEGAVVHEAHGHDRGHGHPRGHHHEAVTGAQRSKSVQQAGQKASPRAGGWARQAHDIRPPRVVPSARGGGVTVRAPRAPGARLSAA